MNFVFETADSLAKMLNKCIAQFSACCDALIIAGDDTVSAQGYYIKQNITRFGHVHYIQKGGDREVFFEKDEFNVGLPYSSDSNRISMRSETVMKLIYKSLGRSPCPS